MATLLTQTLGVYAPLEAEERPAQATDWVARVNGEFISSFHYVQGRQVLRRPLEKEESTGSNLAAGLEVRGRDLLKTLIEDQLLLQRARALDISPEVEAIKHLDRLRQQYNLDDLTQLERKMLREAIDPSEFKHALKTQYLRQQILQKEVFTQTGSPISEQEIKQYYEFQKKDLGEVEEKGDQLEGGARRFHETTANAKAQRLLREYFARLRNQSVIEVRQGYFDTGATYTQDPNQDLLIAARIGDATKVRAMLAKGANPNTESAQGYTALLHAAEMGHSETVEVLLSGGTNPNARSDFGHTALMLAIIEGNKKIVRVLLSKGADANAKENTEGLTALIYAVKAGQIDIVNVLLAKRIDINAIDRNGRTALIHATGEGAIPVMLSLLAKGADPNARDNDGKTALIYAVGENRHEVVRALLDQQADVNTRDSEGMTPLIYAVEVGNRRVVRSLLDNHADVNAAQDVTGDTSLMYAAAKGDQEAVNLLLQAGANSSARNASGVTALRLATENGQDEIVRLLKEAGAQE
jgi:ankyrin repeat protein